MPYGGRSHDETTDWDNLPDGVETRFPEFMMYGNNESIQDPDDPKRKIPVDIIWWADNDWDIEPVTNPMEERQAGVSGQSQSRAWDYVKAAASTDKVWDCWTGAGGC